MTEKLDLGERVAECPYPTSCCGYGPPWCLNRVTAHLAKSFPGQGYSDVEALARHCLETEEDPVEVERLSHESTRGGVTAEPDYLLQLLRAYEELVGELGNLYYCQDENKINHWHAEVERLTPLAGFEWVDGKLVRTVADLSLR